MERFSSAAAATMMLSSSSTTATTRGARQYWLSVPGLHTFSFEQTYCGVFQLSSKLGNCFFLLLLLLLLFAVVSKKACAHDAGATVERLVQSTDSVHCNPA